ncbi:secretory calcium-binding phosphoprotein 8 [Brachyistius frenatus]|uniref:secretory calcium-binding phosphoprotein 8 n=1 Tax=Brachyistius frenatus TaxID=100188 RepID=UPI0037E7926B
MEFLKTALVIAFLTTTSATPMGRRRHHDADITDQDRTQGWLNGNDRQFSRFSHSSSQEDSSESSESQSSESQSSESSSEEIIIPDPTTPAVTTAAMTTIITAEGSTFTPEPDANGTIVMETTPLTATLTPPPINVTSPCNVTGCVIIDIPTPTPITENRGDN